MLPLRNLQNDFKNAILCKARATPILDMERNAVLNSHIAENGFTSLQRLQIYHNNFVITLTESLHSIYRAIHQLVGEEFFTGLAHEYIARYIPTAGDLHTYGHHFAEFLVDFPPARSLPYLPEVARLEWAYHEVFHEADCTTLDLNRLTKVSADNYCSIQFKLHPGCRLFDFRFPILDIWQMCQNENNNNETINLDNGGEKVLVIRRQMEITFERLSAGEFALLSAFNANVKFETACSLALQAEPEFNINVLLQKHVLGGTITDMLG